MLLGKRFGNLFGTLLYFNNRLVHALRLPHELSEFLPSLCSYGHPIKGTFDTGIATQRFPIRLFRKLLDFLKEFCH